MDKERRKKLEADSYEWGMWVREGKTRQNRLGYKRACGFQPARVPDGVKVKTVRNTKRWECRDCGHVFKTARQPQTCRCGGMTFFPMEPVEAANTSSSNEGVKGSVVPDRFDVSDGVYRKIDRIVGRMDVAYKLIMREHYVNRRSLREIAAVLDVSHNKLNRLHAEALAYIDGALRGIP